MAISGITNQATQQAASDAQSTPKTDANDTFMTLLMTELKAQDPTSPMDPTAMVGQMVQFNTLNEIMKIRSLLQSMPQAAATGGN